MIFMSYTASEIDFIIKNKIEKQVNANAFPGQAIFLYIAGFYLQLF